MNKVGNVFWISLIICAIFVLWGVIAPENMDYITTEVQSFLTSKFGWFYILSVAVFLIFSIYLIFSRFGSLRLGKEGDKPEFKRVTWFAMLFSAGMGIGIVFWGTAEPLAHFASPPEADPESIEAATNALRYSVFHWGLQTWGVYTVIGLAIAYFKFRKGAPGLISSTFQPLIGDRTNGWIGKLIDIIAVFATIFGVATSLGLGASQIAGGLSFITDIKNNFSTQLVIIIIVTILFIASAWSGIGKGIKWLSNANIVLAVLLLLLTLCLGPTQFILNTFISTMGSYVESLPSLSFQTGSFDNDFNSWVQNWTIFYWAWFIAWSPFVGTFIARVSKGRTIREFVIGVLFIPSVFCAFWFIVFGGTGLFQEIHGINTGLTDLAQEESLFGVFQGLPMSTLLSVVALFLIGTFFITSADSATFVLGMQTSGGSLNPANKIKLTWGIIQAAIASVLLATGGLNALQTASIVSAFPFAFILLFMVWSLLKVMNEDWKKEKNKMKR